MKYFSKVESVQDLKREYKKLALKFHPDRGGSVEQMQDINNQYEIALKELKIKEKKNNNGQAEEIDDRFIEIIDMIINFNIDIEIIGNWIWVSGNTFEYKEDLKEMGFRWANNKKAWYYKPKDYVARHHKRFSMEEIRQMHGSQRVKSTLALN